MLEYTKNIFANVAHTYSFKIFNLLTISYDL